MKQYITSFRVCISFWISVQARSAACSSSYKVCNEMLCMEYIKNTRECDASLNQRLISPKVDPMILWMVSVLIVVKSGVKLLRIFHSFKKDFTVLVLICVLFYEALWIIRTWIVLVFLVFYYIGSLFLCRRCLWAVSQRMDPAGQALLLPVHAQADVGWKSEKLHQKWRNSGCDYQPESAGEFDICFLCTYHFAIICYRVKSDLLK